MYLSTCLLETPNGLVDFGGGKTDFRFFKDDIFKDNGKKYRIKSIEIDTHVNENKDVEITYILELIQ